MLPDYRLLKKASTSFTTQRTHYGLKDIEN